MSLDKLKQNVALFGGFLSALLLFFKSIGLDLEWFNADSINAFTNVLLAAVPLVIVFYGIYKNTYLVTNKAKEQEKVLKEKGLK